jgi:sec-independent protein translocase protein TatA
MDRGKGGNFLNVEEGIRMGGIGLPELIVVLALAFLVFGAGKLPEIGRGLGKAIKEFKAASRELTGGGNPALESKPTAPPEEVRKQS